ncbi:sialate O-acetylesterase [Sphingomonas sp. S1-29]|uniref:sialate O-acetylesterase n=1 Tax=Sphingomonas sp. S1-29 TaxID=2991074 RepID=UPI002240A22B|nr:sialate O-acetylesterase [Sphingomonas sp. S1-29]UZK70263.1 sialate O-acetylesterase [Sphingomonas sp. S1-29]
MMPSAVRRRCYWALAAASCAVAVGASAQVPTIATPMGDHAVLQRDRPIVVAGTAKPGERLTVKLGTQSLRVRAAADGAWQAKLAPQKAGGPYRLDVTGANGTASASDLMIGDVWLCSGQSNMEYPLKSALNGEGLVQAAGDPDIRLLSMAQRVGLTADEALPERPKWQAATSESAADFSAACLLMVKALKAEAKVPMGAIDSSWGGTRIRPWIAAADARKLPDTAADVDLLALYARDRTAAIRQYADQWGGWWRAKTGDAVGAEPWAAPDKRQWKPVPRIGVWQDYGDPQTAKSGGHVWFRNRFDLAAAPTGDALIELGGVDEIDVVWVNGVAVGSTFGWGSPRSYTVPASVLRQGSNEVIVSVGDSWQTGGMVGPAEAIRITPAGGAPVPLGKGWRYSVETADLGRAPRMPWESHAGVSTLYNGMIAPLGPIALKGAAWYQGESDAGMPGYDARMAALMAGWRRQFGDPQLPFVIVGLANFGAPPTTPQESGWAVVRDEQRRAALADGHAAIVTAIDIGEPTDIHPANKNDLAKRMAQAASVLAYGAKLPPSGPLPLHARHAGSDVVVTFEGVKGRLAASSAAGPIGFELCGPTSCRFAEARAQGSTVRLKGDGQPVDRVRYAWADAPVVNLFDEAPLPAVPFELPVGAE